MSGNLLRQLSEWSKTQGLRFMVLRMDWPNIFMDNKGERGDGLYADSDDLYPDFGDGPTEDALFRLCREKIPSYQVDLITVNRRHSMRLVTARCDTVFDGKVRDTLTEACLDLLEYANEQGILEKT